MNDKIKDKKSELEYIRDQINSSLFAGNRDQFLSLSKKESEVIKEIRILERRIRKENRYKEGVKHV